MTASRSFYGSRLRMDQARLGPLTKPRVGNIVRRLVERTFGWINRARRLAKDWECLNHKALAFLRLASIRLPDGAPDPIPGATQMVFSDLGTPSVAEARGFSAYLWAREKLIALGVPASEIAFMQDHKRSAAKQRLFNDMNAGKKRILIGSSETMGTGVNAHRRLVALHHVDVPWLPSQVAQREGRIERQGNQNDEIALFAYATKSSVDATGWQTLERKARFIDMAMSGDPSIRRIEDVGAQ